VEEYKNENDVHEAKADKNETDHATVAKGIFSVLESNAGTEDLMGKDC
jgi:hypothetical protein